MDKNTSMLRKGAERVKDRHPYEKYYKKLEPAVKSKAEELAVFGYGSFEARDVWEYLIRKVWKNPDPAHVRMYALVSDVLSVKPGDLMSFKTVEAYRSPNWFAELDEKELDALFNGERTEE